MTILPKKKQQPGSHQQPSQQQQTQQDGRHGNLNIADSSIGNGPNAGPSILNQSANAAVASSSIGSIPSSIPTSASISSFLSTSSTGAAMSSLPSPHHSNEVGSVISGSAVGVSGSGMNSMGGSVRRSVGSALQSCHDANELDGGIGLGPHRKRVAVASPSNTASSAHSISSPARSIQSDRSSPYRTTRRSNRATPSGANVVMSNAPPTSSASTVLPIASSISSNGGAYSPPGSVPVATTSVMSSNHIVRGTPSPAAGDDETGYNSGDEYESTPYCDDDKSNMLIEDIERKFEEKLLASKGFRIKKMQEDGACLFRAVADQVYGDEDMHNVVRKLCMDYMAKNSDYFNQFITEDFSAYIERKRQDFVHGNHVEMQAMAELFNRPIQVYQYSCDPINTFHSPHETDNPAIRVSYHGNHYNSVVDPYAATIGVGLGLPQFYPGLAEKNLMSDAVHASEQHEIEEAMLEDKLRATDWEATDEQLQEQVARESYLQWLRDQEKQMKENAATRDGVSTKTMNALASGSQSPDAARPSCSKSPNRTRSTDCGDTASASVAGSSRYYDSKGWDDDDDLLKQVLALSQQEYFDSFKNHRQEDSDKKPSSSYASP